MWLLLTDFSRRYWPAFPVVAFVAFLAGVCAFLPLFLFVMIAGPLVVLGDSTRGALQAHGVLPVSRKTLARAVWFKSVVLFPLVCVPILGIGQLFGLLVHPEAANTLAQTLFVFVVGMGYASLMFLLLLTRTAASTTGYSPNDAKGMLIEGLWLLCIMALGGLAMRLEDLGPSTSESLLLVPALVLIFAGFTLAERFLRIHLRARTTVAAAALPPNATTRFRMPGRWAGFIAPWLWEAAYALGIYAGMVVMVLVCWLIYPSSSGAQEAGTPSVPMFSLLPFVIILAVGGKFMTWIESVRALRMLPLPRFQIALLYLLLPCVLICAVLGFDHLLRAFMLEKGTPPEMLALLLPLLGLFSLCNVLYLRVGSAARFIIPFVYLYAIFAVGGLLLESGRTNPRATLVVAALFAAGCLAFSFLALHYLIEKSSNAYRHKPFVMGQPANRR